MGKSRVVQVMEMKEAERLAISDKLQAEEFSSRVADARKLQKERGLEKASLKMRVWHSVRCSHANIEVELNRMEGEGWTLVNILSNGYDRATIVAARVIEMDLPDEVETPTEKTERTEGEEEAERLRKLFEEETGGEDAADVEHSVVALDGDGGAVEGDGTVGEDATGDAAPTGGGV